jgi:flavin-dependent dehydrogenase
MFTGSRDYDVIVVGGRPAGATLAARLGMAGLHVLLLERAQFPSLPGASSPIIYSSTMALLDEIGADEGEYARSTPKLHYMVNDSPGMQMKLRIPEAYGRDYAYAIDRARFDDALLRTAGRLPSVNAWDGFSVTDLLWEDGCVVGVEGHSDDKHRRRLTADLVVGADGRFSTVARKVDAEAHDEATDHPTSLLYAYWRGARPNHEPCAMAYGENNGYGLLVMDSADDTVCVCVEGRAELLESGGRAEVHYLDLVRRATPIWQRIENGEMVTSVRGMRKVGNLYRTPGGPGWALVGDAYHQKDPIDGQGIYDAVFTAKLLSDAILRARSGAMTWEAALAWYDTAVRAETFPMYQSTLERVRGTLYNNTPEWLVKLSSLTFGRWILEDRVVQERMGLMLVRKISPRAAITLPITLGALLRGPLRDLSRHLDREIERIPTS